MEASASDKCLERLGTSINALLRDPEMFLHRVHPGDRSRCANKLRDVTPEADVQVVLYDENNRPRRDKISLGMFIEFVDDDTGSYKVGLVVGCLLSRALSGGQPQDLLLVVELPGENGETAKMPLPDSVCRVVPTSAITCKIDVEQRPAAPAAKLLADDVGFVIALGLSFYGIDQDGTHAIGSYSSNLLSVARARRGEMFATTESCKLLSVELDKGRVKEIAMTRVVDTSRKQHHETEFQAYPQVQVRGLCFAEGRPAAFDSKLQPGACQMYGIAKDVPNRGGDCLCTVSPSGRLDIVFELGRKDVLALAVVPVRLSAADPVNVWSRVGPNDADTKSMRFIIWTEKGGLFVVDETRRCLQQLGGDLVRSLEISAVAFDGQGDLFAAGSNALYSVSPTGRVVEVASLSHLPGHVSGLCSVPRQLANPEMYEEEIGQVEQKSPTRSRSRSWWPLSRGSSNSSLPQLDNQPTKDSTSSVTNLLRLLRFKSRSSAESKPRSMNLEPQQTRSQPRQPQQGSFSGRRTSNPLLPSEGTSLGETNRRGSGTLTRGGPSIPHEDDDYSPSRNNTSFQTIGSTASTSPAKFKYANQDRQQPPPSKGGPYFPTETNGSYDDYDMDDTIRPPSGPPPPSAASRRQVPQHDIPLPPPTAPPPTTARAAVSSPAANMGGRPQANGGGRGTKYPDVASMLLALGLSQYIADFRSEEMLDINLLCSMYQSERDFKEMLRSIGVAKLGHREMIAHAVKQQLE